MSQSRVPTLTPTRSRRGPGARAVFPLLVAILLGGLALRLWGLDYGLPYLNTHTEPRNIDLALRMVREGDLDPDYYNYPSLFFYTHAAATAAYGLAGELTGAFDGPGDLDRLAITFASVARAPQEGVVLLNRLVAVALSLVVLLLAYACAARLAGDRRAGLLAALMVAVAPSVIDLSDAANPNILAAGLALAVLWLALGIYERGATWTYALAGLVSGFAVAAKYNLLLVVVAVAVAHVLRRDWTLAGLLAGLRDPKIYLAAACCGLGFVLAMPYAVLDYGEVLGAIREESNHYRTGHPGWEDATFYLSYPLENQPVAVLLALIGGGRGLRRRSGPVLVTLAFPLIYYIAVSTLPVKNVQTLLPVLVFVFVLAATAAVDLLGDRGGPWGRVGLAALLAAGLVIPLAASARYKHDLDVRFAVYAEARAWLSNNLPDGASVYLHPAAPYLDPDRFAIVPGKNTIPDADWFLSAGPEYAVFTSWQYARYFDNTTATAYDGQRAIYERVFAALEPVRTFQRGEHVIRVYRRPAP